MPIFLKKFLKLIDFSKCIQFQELHEKMGIVKIPTLPKIKFEKEVVWKVERTEIDPQDARIDIELKDNSVEIDFEDISIDDQELLSFKGRKVAAYIRDQNVKKFRYKYHLCNCSTLQDMKAGGRLQKYFITKIMSGVFPVNDISRRSSQKINLKLDLCNNCKKLLIEKKLYFSNFNLAEYFKKNETYVPRELKSFERFSEIQTYTPDHKELSREYKKSIDHICQRCKVDCSSLKNLLHLHHINGIKSNNYPHNLKILCVACHSKEYNHSHMKKKYRPEILVIGKLRKAQGILNLEDS